MKSFILKANAKINLFLDITGKRENGYHELDSVMLSVGIADILRFEKTEKAGVEIICDKEGFPLDESNIICKAAKALFEKYKLNGSSGLRVMVEKNIPSQAGMGGGSADGAAALIAVNELFELGASEQQLMDIGAGIGADVPFCLKGGCRICQGIGERLTGIDFPEGLALVVIKPDTAVSTPEAYKAYDRLTDPEHRSISKIKSALKKENTAEIANELFNAFEFVIYDKKIEAAKSTLKANNALGVLMTGSGSAVFGIFESFEKAEKAFITIKESNKNTYLCTSERKGIDILDKG